MTDEQIIKAVGICRTQDTCRGCPYHELYTAACVSSLMKDVLDLINCRKAENESLKQIIDEQDKEIIKLQKRIIFWREDLNYQPEKIKSEAIKEFAEKLKNKIWYSDWCPHESKITPEIITNLVKEMTEEQK